MIELATHEHEAPSIGDNSSKAQPLELLRDYLATARNWLARTKQVTNKEACDEAGNIAGRLRQLHREADEERDVKVRPHLTAQRDINGVYKPLLEEADKLAQTIKKASEEWMKAEKRRLEDEQRRKHEAELAAAAAERARIEQEQAALAQISPALAMLAIPDAVPEPPQPPAPVKVMAGGENGRRMSLRQVTVYVVTDYDAALRWARHQPEVREAVEKVCKAAARAGETVPGVTARIEEHAR